MVITLRRNQIMVNEEVKTFLEANEALANSLAIALDIGLESACHATIWEYLDKAYLKGLAAGDDKATSTLKEFANEVIPKLLSGVQSQEYLRGFANCSHQYEEARKVAMKKWGIE